MKLALWEKYTDVYAWNAQCRKPIVINQGGTYSSKTISILQVMIERALENPGCTVTVTSQDLPNLKRDALKEFKVLISQDRVRPFFHDTTLELGPYKLLNGSKIEFVCFQNAKDAEGAKRQFLYVSEAPGVAWDIFFELKKRTEVQTYLDYNPTAAFWAHSELMHLEDTQVFVSTAWDNKFCPDKKKKELLEYKIRHEQTGDEYWLNQWRVYGQGKTGITSGTVFPMVKRISHFPDSYYLKKNNDGIAFMYGVDFSSGGFQGDPCAITKCGFRAENDRVVGQQIFYEPYNSYELKDLLPTLGILPGRDWLVCDSANLEAIDLLAQHGYMVVAAKKDPGSVVKRIELLTKHGIDITIDSIDWFIEQQKYVWKKANNRDSRREPKDAFNHLWDSFGYAAMFFRYGWGELRNKVKIPQRPRVARGYR